MEWIKKEIAQELERFSNGNPVEILETPDERLGDLSTNIAFKLAKQQGARPDEMAREIASSFPSHPLVERVEVAGGYINFFINWREVTKRISEMPEIAWSVRKREGRVIIEYPSVNPGKPWHVGHGRNAVLGDSIYRLMRHAGYEVVRQDYIDDLGLQVAQVVWGVMNLKDLPERKGLLEKEDQWQGRVYVKVASMMDRIENEIRDIMRRLEEGDEALRDMHEKVVDSCLKAQYETAFRLGIYHDVKIHESHIVHSGLFEKGFEMLKQSGHIVFEKEGKNAGCWVARLSHLQEFQGMKDADKVLIRSDGTATYTGKDVVYHLWKFGILDDPMKYRLWMVQPNGDEMWESAMDGEKRRFNGAEMIINVIGSEQSYPQNVVRSILKLIGYEKEAENYFHLAYEHVWFREKGEAYKFSGRKGTWVGYSVDEVLDRIKSMSMERMADREIEGKEEIAEKIAVGAFRYAMLSTDWSKKVAFDFEEVLSFEGNTAPYLQYSLVRARKVLEKAGYVGGTLSIPDALSEKEVALLKMIAKTADAIERAVGEKKPHLVANHAFKLSEAFNSFYQSERIIGSEKEEFRLWLVSIFSRTLSVLMQLMGIPEQKEM